MMAGTIVEIAAGEPRFSILVEAVTKAGLAGALDNVTVFAPNNDAFTATFAALGVTGVADLSVDQLTAILTYHVLPGSVDAAAAIALAGSANPTAQALGGTLDLSLAGSTLMVDQANVIAADVMASNGIIHEIDAVLVPNIVDVVTTDPELTSLTAALVAVDGSASMPNLVGTLGGSGPFTVLAPVDTGFAAMLTANGVPDLGAFVSAVGVDTVITVLQYHVAAGALFSPDVVAATEFDTLVGPVTVTVEGSTVTLNKGIVSVPGTNDSVIEVVDLVTSNGVIHKLSKVITPAP